MRSLNVFVSSKFSNRYMLRFVLAHLKMTFPVLNWVSDWINLEKPTSFENDVGSDLQGIDKSDLVLVFYPWGIGSRCETMYALGKNKPVILLIDELSLPEKITVSDYSEFFPLVKLRKISKESDLNKLSLDNFQIVVTNTDLFLRAILKFIQLQKLN